MRAVVAKFYYMLVLQILAKFISMRHLYLFKRDWFIIYISKFLTNQSLSWQTSRSYAPSENVFCFLRSGKHFPPFPCAITFSNPLCYCHDYHYCHHCHRTTTTIDIEANGVLPSMNHGRCWEGAALESDEAARALVPRLSFFFFFFFIITHSRRLSFDLCRTGPIWPELGCIGWRPKRPK